MSEQIVEARTEVANASVIDTTLVQAQPGKVVSLNHEAAFASYTPQEQQEIMALSESIDVLKEDNVAHYGGAVMKKTFDQCGELLKKERGSEADQSVIAMVNELSKKAKDSYEDFNMLINVKKPNFIQRALLALRTGRAWSDIQADKIQESAVTNYDLLMQLKGYESLWLKELEETNLQVDTSAKSDIEVGSLLEKYLIAGMFAQERIAKEVEAKREQYQSTGLQVYDYERENLERGAELFDVKMSKLQQSLEMYRLSLSQLLLIKRTVQNLKLTITSEMQHSMTLMSQQLRNALMDAKLHGIQDGYRGITHLNDELIRKVCENVALSAQESEELLYAAFFNIDSAKTAVTTLINCCQEIQKVAGEKLPEMKANTEELSKLFDDLDAYMQNPLKTLKEGVPTNAGTTAKGNSELNF